MVLISPGGENLLDFPELRQVLSSYDGDHRDPLWWPQKGQSTCELLGGLSGFLSRQCRCLRPFVELVPEPEDSSPVLKWILGYFWSLPREVSPLLERGMHVPFPPKLWQLYGASLRVDQGICGFPSRLSQEAFQEAFPRGYPSKLSHRAVPRASVV